MSLSERSLITIGEVRAPAGAQLSVVEVPGGHHVTLTATSDLAGIATNRFATPAAAVALALVPDAAADASTRLLGFAFTQFALPVIAGPHLDFDFAPAPNLRAPAAVGLLLVRHEDRVTLVAPLTNVHEQIVAVHDGTLRWGWHGDLDTVDTGFATTAGIYDGGDVREVLQRWVSDLCGEAPIIRRRDRNPITSHLSYWTDNGAAYWYRTEAGRTITESVADAVTALRAAGVPVHAIELDSWCYPHEIARPIAEIGYPSDVPPTGMLTWTPRADAYREGRDHPGDPLEAWSTSLGRPPLAIHARHISPASPYLDVGEWWVGSLAAHPVDPTFFRRWFDDAVRWGVCCIEQDWMLLYWFGVRELRSVPGRARAWQEALDRHGADTDIGLVWCMATPADIVAAAALPNVVAIRTCDDYRFAEDPALLWLWYLTVNHLVGVLGIPAFKDVFFSAAPPEGADPIDGDPHAELEALLSALSAGPVGIGDRTGRTDRDVVLRTCDADGRIRHVDRPVALIDACLFGEPTAATRLAWATTTTTRDDDVWTYVVAINASTPAVEVADELALVDIGLPGARSVLAWRTGVVTDTETLTATLPPREWAYFVVAPPGHQADEGDLSKYVTVPSELP